MFNSCHGHESLLDDALGGIIQSVAYMKLIVQSVPEFLDSWRHATICSMNTTKKNPAKTVTSAYGNNSEMFCSGDWDRNALLYDFSTNGMSATKHVANRTPPINRERQITSLDHIDLF